MRNKKQQGFTLIELVVVIVILGILAATALPRFLDLRGDAEAAAIAGVAGGLSSANGVNAAGCSVTNNVATPNRCVLVNSCADVGNLLAPPMALATNSVPYAVAADTAIAANGATIECTLTRAGAPNTVFSATGAAITP